MTHLRARALNLRNQGYSYGMIHEALGVSKSTLSNWFSQMPFKPNQEVLKRIGHARLKVSLQRHELKLLDIASRKKEAAAEVGQLTPRDIFMLGIGIYLGEGSKSIEEIRIVNSNPLIIKLALRWLHKFMGLTDKHFRITLHSYPDIDERSILSYWSRETAIPIKQFTKVVVDRRGNKSKSRERKLPYGTAHLYVRSGGTIIPGVKSLHRKIIGWIE